MQTQLPQHARTHIHHIFIAERFHPFRIYLRAHVRRFRQTRHADNDDDESTTRRPGISCGLGNNIVRAGCARCSQRSNMIVKQYFYSKLVLLCCRCGSIISTRIAVVWISLIIKYFTPFSFVCADCLSLFQCSAISAVLCSKLFINQNQVRLRT